VIVILALFFSSPGFYLRIDANLNSIFEATTSKFTTPRNRERERERETERSGGQMGARIGLLTSPQCSSFHLAFHLAFHPKLLGLFNRHHPFLSTTAIKKTGVAGHIKVEVPVLIDSGF